MIRRARISDCGRYRYSLHRIWNNRSGRAVFVMLNPSTADAERDDPTIRRCIGYARAWGLGGVVVVNLYAYRATRPVDLWHTDDPIGPANDQYLVSHAGTAWAMGTPLIAAWGTNARPERVTRVLRLPFMDRLTALAVTKDGHPRHPLRLRSNLTPQPWRAP